MLTEGDPAPDFDLPQPAADGDQTYRLSAATKVGPVVLTFYPVADVPGAADLLGDLAAVDWASVADRMGVLAVGVGDRVAHDRLVEEVDLPFPLLLDPDGVFAQRYELLERAGPGVRTMPQALFVVDHDCKITYTWAESDSDESPPMDEVKAAVASL